MLRSTTLNVGDELEYDVLDMREKSPSGSLLFSICFFFQNLNTACSHKHVMDIVLLVFYLKPTHPVTLGWNIHMGKAYFA